MKFHKNKIILSFVLILLFAVFSVFGFSFVKGSFRSSNVHNTLASAEYPADINSDGVVDIFDLSILLSQWGVVQQGQPNEWPNSGNTGVPSGVNLTSSGGITVTQPNTIIDSKDISGSVIIKAPGVIIKNSKIHGNGTGDGVLVMSGDVTIYDSEIYNFENGIGYLNWKAFRVNIHGMSGDGAKIGTNTEIAYSYIHDNAPSEGAHADGLQLQDGSTNTWVHHNYIDMGLKTQDNAAIFIQPFFGPSTDGPLLIENNYLNGGGITLFCLPGTGDGGAYYISNITIRNNTFGPLSKWGHARVQVPSLFTNNVDTNGNLVNGDS